MQCDRRINLTNFHSKTFLKFENVTKFDVKKKPLHLSFKKVTRNRNIQAKILKEQFYGLPTQLNVLINKCL